MAALPRRAASLALGMTALTLMTALVPGWLSALGGAGRGPTTVLARPAAQDVPPGQIVVRGRIDYIDRESDKAHPAAGLRVEIWDKDKGFPDTSSKLAEARTDANGYFEAPPVVNQDRDGPGGEAGITGQDIFLKLFTDNGDVKLYQLGTKREFVWQSYDLNKDEGIQNNVGDGVVSMPRLLVQATTRDVEALWTFVNMAQAWLYMKSASGTDPGKVTGYWSRESTVGPKYDPATRELFFRDDTAGYGDVVVQHTAYALLHNIYGTLPAAWAGCTAGPDATIKSEVDPNCALIQGFATFLPLAVFQDPLFESQTLRALDMDAPKPVTPGWNNGDRVPGRIAGAFWDLYENDQTVEEFDTFNARFADIWEVFRAKNPLTFAEWWAGWKALGKDTCGAVGSLYQNSIDYSSGLKLLPIPDVVLEEDQRTVLNLAHYITDADCPNDRLKLTIVDYGAPEAERRADRRHAHDQRDAAAELVRPDDRPHPGDGRPVHGERDVQGHRPLRERLPADHAADPRSGVRALRRDDHDRSGRARRRHRGRAGAAPVARGHRAAVQGHHGQRQRHAAARVLAQPVHHHGLLGARGHRAARPGRLRGAPGDRTELDGAPEPAAGDLDGPPDPPVPGAGEHDDPHRPDRRGRRRRGRPRSARVVHRQLVRPDGDDAQDQQAHVRLHPASGLRGQHVPGAGREGLQGPAGHGRHHAHLGHHELEADHPAQPAARQDGRRQQGRAAEPGGVLRAERQGDRRGRSGLEPAVVPAGLQHGTTLTVTGQGTQNVCLRPRPGFVGCETARFVVRDPKGGTDSHEVTTCWREIKILLPYMQKPARTAQLQQRGGR
ncbi:MAG: hypothetical protein U0470_05915 [Anaerolineae bacterium]